MKNTKIFGIIITLITLFLILGSVFYYINNSDKNFPEVTLKPLPLTKSSMKNITLDDVQITVPKDSVFRNIDHDTNIIVPHSY